MKIKRNMEAGAIAGIVTGSLLVPVIGGAVA
jgi:hypothetical protein